MCSVDGCGDFKLEKKLNLFGASCRKCEENKAEIVLQGKFPYCRECFFVYFKHKYSGGIGKAKLLRPHDKVLLAFSGSFSSLCLLDLIHSSLVEDRKKKTIFKVVLLYIDERYNRPVDERRNVLQCLSDMVVGYNYKLYYSCLTPVGEEVIVTEDPDAVIGKSFDDVNSILSGFTSITSKLDFTEKIRNNVLLESAKKLGCTKIFTAETSDHIATRIIGNISMGRGKSLHSDTGFINNVSENIVHVKPLRECFKKEVAFYNIFNKLHRHSFHWLLEVDKFSSIQKLTESFITELQHSFPSTVATVTSTGGKISVPEFSEKSCLLCQSQMSEVKELSAEEAMRLSELVTSYGPGNYDAVNFSVIPNGECNSQKLLDTLSICYPCSILIRESKCKKDLLRPYVNNLEEIERHKMYNDIKDFLI